MATYNEQLQANNIDLQTIFETVNNLPGKVVLPVLANPGSATDLAKDVEMLDEYGRRVVGQIQVLYETDSTNGGNNLIYAEDTLEVQDKKQYGYYRIVGAVRDDVILRKGGIISAAANVEEFGNASPLDVAEGKTFTSASGLKIVGTNTSIGGGSLPSGISVLNTGTYTPTSDISSSTSISHGLGTKPNFFIIAPEGAVDGTADIGYQYGQAMIYRYFKSPSYTTCGWGEYSFVNSNGELGMYIGRQTSLNTSTITIRAGSDAKFKAGVTYRWVAGVLDGIG